MGREKKRVRSSDVSKNTTGGKKKVAPSIAKKKGGKKRERGLSLEGIRIGGGAFLRLTTTGAEILEVGKKIQYGRGKPQ